VHAELPDLGACDARRGLLKRPFRLEDGYVEVPRESGFGIELDGDAVEEKRCRVAGGTHADPWGRFGGGLVGA